jgi:4-alpha-glucanotransferase
MIPPDTKCTAFLTRGSGVLMHITSLPTPFGIGDMGPAARRFADALADAGARSWQMLPLNPSNPENGESPYFSASAFAGNPLLISPELLVEDGILDKSDIASPPRFPENEVDYPAVRAYKSELIAKAFERHGKTGNNRKLNSFCEAQRWWLDDFCLFAALHRAHDGKPWTAWPRSLRDRATNALSITSASHEKEIEREKFAQWLFFSQWFKLKSYCGQKKVTLIGDLPIYVSLESVDVWVNPHLFKLDRAKHPTGVSGVPPDYFSATGQLWNNPVYDWDAMYRNRFDWWEQRFRATFERFDIVRIDHFRGLVQYWEVPAGEKTAINGSWKDVPTRTFFDAMIQRLGSFPVIAEDLGIITPDVREIIDHYQFLGMKVLMFAFGDNNPDHPYLPHTYDENCIAYTGTHDNLPFREWLEHASSPDERERAYRYLGNSLPITEAIWAFIWKLMQSKANLAIISLQDLLALGADARMNDPGKTFGNWKWRCTPEQFESVPWARIRQLTKASGR